MGEKGFTRENGFITKGILVIMLLIHHVFYPDNTSNYGIHTVISNYVVQNSIILFCRICIAGFAFLTAYGMCQKYKNIGESKKEFPRLNMIRLIKLEASVMIVYFAAALYKQFIMGESIRALYLGEGKNIFGCRFF